MRDKITILIIFSMVLTIFTFILPAETCKAATLDVGSGYEYTSIQSAIDAANNSDTIRIHSGTYEEFIEINKELTLVGDGSSEVIINSKNQNNPSPHTIKISSSNVSISGCTIKNTYHSSSSFSCLVISAGYSGCTISDNLITDGGNGVYLITSTNNVITGNTVENNLDNGVSFTTNADNNQINSNTIRNNGITGVKIYRSSDNTFYDNTISSNTNYGVTLGQFSNNNLFYRNDFSENSNGNANDADSNNWYSGNQGNYWGDYDDYDSNNDGIGDSPYTTGGVNDQKPLGYFLNQKPVSHISSISPNPATEGTTIQFSGYGTDDENIVEWEWKINNNIVSTAEDFSYSSLSEGTYSVYFKVKDNDGTWSDPAHQTLTVNPSGGVINPNQKPTAYIQGIMPSTTEFGDKVKFNGYGVDEDGDIAEYNWSSSIDGYLPESSSFIITSLSVGTHNIAFKVKDDEYLWSNPVYATVKIESVESEDNENPVAISNGPYNAYVNETITFNASDSYDNDGSIAKYRWDFGDETTSNSKTVTHTYTEEDEYTVTLTITDNLGAQDTETTTATILSENGGQQNINNQSNDTSDDKWVIPGFETITFLLLIVLIALFKKKRK